MATIDTAMAVVHLLFAGIWAGATVFVSVGVVPAAQASGLGTGAAARIAARFKTTSRASAVLLLATGGHAAGEGYTVASLLETTAGNLVLAMVVLWLALAALSEVGASRLEDGRVESASTIFGIASIVAVLLLVVGGLLPT